MVTLGNSAGNTGIAPDPRYGEAEEVAGAMPDGARGTDPVIQRRRLGNELRRARQDAGLTQRDVVDVMGWSQSKVMRIENGAFNISPNDLRALLEWLAVGEPRMAEFIALSVAARGMPHWHIYRDVVTPAHLAFLGYEGSASVVRNFAPSLVPALLQTEEYARQVIGIMGGGDPERVDALVDLRMERQEILVRRPLRQLHFVLDEAAIRRVVGGPAVMRRQLIQLKEMAACSNVTIRVVPFSAGVYPRLCMPFVLFTVPELDDGDVLYLEGPFGELVVRESGPDRSDGACPAAYLHSFRRMEQLARPDDLSVAIDRVLAGLASGRPAGRSVRRTR